MADIVRDGKAFDSEATRRQVVVGPGGVAVGAATASTATLTNVASSATTVQALAANTARVGCTVYNDSSAILYLKFGTTASTSSYTVQIPAGGFYEFGAPVYTGRLDAIWSAANGNARITELSA